MSTNEHFEAKIQLLNSYALCLQKQNQSKNKEITTLHNHLELLTKQNDSLRKNLKTIQPIPQQSSEEYACQSQQLSFYCDQESVPVEKMEVQCQTEIQEQIQDQHLVDEVAALRQEVSVRDARIAQYQLQCEEMYDGIVSLEKSLAQKEQELIHDIQKISQLQESVKSQERRRTVVQRKFEEVNRTVQSFDEESQAVRQQYQTMEIEMEELIAENNQLIERTRQLEKEKNNYYQELKKMSRISFGTENSKTNSSIKKVSKVKDQRWRQIQSNLKILQMQNEAIQSNLQVSR